jgi:Cu-Zn family superoxide dismutase
VTKSVRLSVLAAAIGVAAASLAGVAAAQDAPVAGAATAVMRDASGRTVGTAAFGEVAGGVRLTLQVSGLTPGNHGIHVHAVGQCDPPAFTSAGAHFNPEVKQHGLSNAAGPHAGDLPVLVAAASGQASYTATTPRVSLGAGPDSLFDADGSALVIHAADDDQMTDPTGNSGDRIACGVLVRGATRLPATGAASAVAPGLVALSALLVGAPAARRALRRYRAGA